MLNILVQGGKRLKKVRYPELLGFTLSILRCKFQPPVWKQVDLWARRFRQSRQCAIHQLRFSQEPALTLMEIGSWVSGSRALLHQMVIQEQLWLPCFQSSRFTSCGFTFPLANSLVKVLLSQLFPSFVKSEDYAKILKKVELYKERGSIRAPQ